MNTRVRLDNINSFYDRDIMFLTYYYTSNLSFLLSQIQFPTIDGIDTFMFIYYDDMLGSF